MEFEITSVLLERYLAGECTLAERTHVERWMREDPARRAYVDSLRTLGDTWTGERPRFDSRAAWSKMTERLEPDAAPVRRLEREAPVRRAALRASSRGAAVRRWIATGALAAAALGGVAVGAQSWLANRPAPPPRELATAAGQRMRTLLPDGTRLWLAPESRVLVDGDYGRATRTVQLEGQAYFEVTHDDAVPFRVLAGNTVAWDLGTRFTVRAYSGEDVRVAVEEGSVAIPQALSAPLMPGDVGVVDSAGRGTVRHGMDLGRYTAWTGGTLEFQDTPLPEAVADLARWYQVEVQLADPELAQRHITVVITETSVERALDLITPAIGARYEREGPVVVLHSIQTP